jgi:Predicted membrane protein (DUF2232)
MLQFALIGIGAGVAAALLFASVTSGSLLSVALFYLAPLPMMIAALGWSHWSALIAALTAALALAAVFGPMFFFGFLASAGLPAWWLGYLAMLARPAAAGGNGGTPTLEWYPPGRLVMWAALVAVLVVAVAIGNFGLDVDSFRSGLHHALAQLLQIEEHAGEPQALVATPSQGKQLIDFLVVALPPAAVVLATLTNVLNLWLAGRIVKFSGRLSRPWPQLSAMTLPRPLMAALALAIALSFTDGLVGILAGVVAAGLVMAFGVLGFAVLHAITQGMSARAFMLGGVYAAVLVFGWPVLVLGLLGLAEALIDIRARVARMRARPPAGGA